MRRALFLLAMSLIPLCCFSFAQDSSSVPDLEGVYTRLGKALERRELDTLAAILAADFRGIDADGNSLNREQLLADWRNRITNAARIGPVTHEIKPLPEVSGAVAMDVRRRLFFLPQGSNVELFEESRLRDTWIRTGDGWRLRSSEAHGYPIDGEVERPQARFKSPRIATLAQQVERGDSKATDGFWKALAGAAPLVEPVAGDPNSSWITYLWRGDSDTLKVGMNGGVPGEVRPKPLARLPGTDIWYRTEKTPRDARFAYVFLVTGTMHRSPSSGLGTETVTVTASHPDPLNPRMFNGFSIVEPEGGPLPPWIVPAPESMRGSLTVHRMTSQVLEGERTITVYVPQGKPDRPYHLLILFDGEDYQRLIPTPTILDHLIEEKKIPPTVAVLVHSGGTQGQDLHFSEKFTDFVARELVPWAREHYPIEKGARSVVVGGLSLGGLTAAYCARRHPTVFGNILSQSGAFWQHREWPAPLPAEGEGGWLVREFRHGRRLPLQFYLEVGRFEAGSMLNDNRRLRDVLTAEGYPVTYREFNGGHDYVTWRYTLADGLIALLGRNRTRR